VKTNKVFLQDDDNRPVLALTVAYEGSGFHGFARQSGQVTVQGELEHALQTLYKTPIETVGAGRTDAGVHANGQVVSFALDPKQLVSRGLPKLMQSLNALTPDGLVVRAIEQKEPGFSARFSAKERIYRYRLYPRAVPPVFMAPYAWWLPGEQPLDVNAMRQAAQYLVGEHDFASFCVAKSAVDKTTVREITGIFIFGMQHLGEPLVMVEVSGNAFLHSMVRVIVGTLVEVGLRRRQSEWVAEVLAATKRQAAGPTAPAHGLTFWRVKY
jgi:tRNA pseudouridine38-40 synthase